MNDLCADIGYKSINFYGEQLCGDHVEIVEPNDDSMVIVLSDGLGSGVKASILSILTSKIISTMLAEELSLEECVETIAATLPVCSVRNLAYATFTIIHLKDHQIAELIQYDNPHIIVIATIRFGIIPKRKSISAENSQICYSIAGKRYFVAMSDSCPYAGLGKVFNHGWTRDDIAVFMESLSYVGYTAKTLSTMLIDKCNDLYGQQPGDDATACIVRIRKREPMNLLFGPPSNRDDDDRMMSLFFSKAGKHIICGGTTSSIAAKFLGKPLNASLNFEAGDVPPIAEIEGVDLVTEGIITISKVLEYAKDYLGENKKGEHWNFKRDGASLICRMLFEEATDINFFVGRAVNPAHQSPDLPINFNIKMNLVEELSKCLKKMGKKIKVSYF